MLHSCELDLRDANTTKEQPFPVHKLSKPKADGFRGGDVSWAYFYQSKAIRLYTKPSNFDLLAA